MGIGSEITHTHMHARVDRMSCNSTFMENQQGKYYCSVTSTKKEGGHHTNVTLSYTRQYTHTNTRHVPAHVGPGQVDGLSLHTQRRLIRHLTDAYMSRGGQGEGPS